MVHVSERGVYGAAHSLYRRLPPSWRTGIKKALVAQGHHESKFDRITAHKDATGKKRLDRVLESLIGTLGVQTAERIAEKVCIDFGAGYVPTDGVALWLLGAREVHGVDYNYIARPKEIARAVRTADADRVESQLSALQLDSGWCNRLDTLRRWAREGANAFPPGYSYVAPADVMARPALIPNFDVIVSTSVLEHIAPSLLVPLLDALKARENADATHVHRVDLRDHRDFEHDPYGFLDPSAKFDAEADADCRGNGMTLQDWERLLDEHPHWQLAVSEYEAGRPHLLPAAARVPHGHVVADCLVLRTVRRG